MHHLELLGRLAQPAATKIVLLVLDGVGDLQTQGQQQTALAKATIPHLDALAKRSALGRIDPVAPGITPGSGPGHLALFGYDPTRPETDIGRGVLEALGLGLELGPDDVAVRGNFATADGAGNLTDRRAGRPPTSEGRRICAKLRHAAADFEGPQVIIEAGEAHRFVLILRGQGLSAEIADTDPQKIGVTALRPTARTPAAQPTVDLLERLLELLEAAIADEKRANRLLLRGFSRLPDLPGFSELYQLRAGAFAGYPLYRGVASVCGMKVVPCSKDFAEAVATVGAHWNDFDFFFVHVKKTDQAGEDGDFDAKVEALEDVDRSLPDLLALEPDVIAITGDHSTPAPMHSHSWHPVPLLLWSRFCFIDPEDRFDESAAARGHLGTFPARNLMGLILANAGRLAKFGA